jgi:hypothetical protein
MLVPTIKVEISDLKYNTCSIAELLFNDLSNNSLPFIERIYKAFPQLSNSLNEGMSNEEIYKVVEAILIDEYSIGLTVSHSVTLFTRCEKGRRGL